MMTTDGKLHIKRYLAGWNPSIARSIAYGIGGKAEALGDTSLEFEVARSEVVLTSYDFINDRIIFKSAVPMNFEGTIYEIGLFSTTYNDLAGGAGSRLLATFDSESEGWLMTADSSVPTYVTTNTRIGVNSPRLAPTASTTVGMKLSEVGLDLSEYSGADKFAFAYNVTTANISNVMFRFHSATSDYYQFAMGAQTAGYKVTSLNKADATISGAPSWNNITEVRAYAVAGAGGAGQVDLDGIRVEDTDTVNPNYVMVARELLTSPVTKEAGKTLEVEFSLKVNL